LYNSDHTSTALLLRRAYTVPKRNNEPNEDAFAHRCWRGTYAVSDGASTCFGAAEWSRILVDRYVLKPHFDPRWVAQAAASFAALFDPTTVPRYVQDALERGSFASLLGVRVLHSHGKVRVFAIGDTVAFLCDGERVIATWPYTSPDQFDQSPILISTNEHYIDLLAKNAPARDYEVEWATNELAEPRLLCVTDALGLWLMSPGDDEPSRITTLLNAEIPEAFRDLVLAERDAARMRRDDTTMLALW
jgi:hypothetical protein